MASKKVMISVTASAALASFLLLNNEAEAASHKVQSGESLWTIAQKYNTTVSQLKKINNLSSDIIHPDQILETSTTKTYQTRLTILQHKMQSNLLTIRSKAVIH